MGVPLSKREPIRTPNIRVPGGKDYMLDTSSRAAVENDTHFYAYAGGDWGWVQIPTKELGARHAAPGRVALWGGRQELLDLLDLLTEAVRDAPAV